MTFTKLARVRIDRAHSEKLASGEPVTIKVPCGAEIIELRLAPVRERNVLAELADFVCNGRCAT